MFDKYNYDFLFQNRDTLHIYHRDSDNRRDNRRDNGCVINLPGDHDTIINAINNHYSRYNVNNTGSDN